MQGNAHKGRQHEGIAPFLRHGYIPKGASGARAVSYAPRSHAQAFFPLVPGAACMSQSGTFSVSPVTTALLLAQSEDFAVIDRRALREAGVGQVRVMTGGVYAARFLVGKEKSDRGAMPDVVLVHHQLADMTGADFVELVRSHPRLAGLPILHVSASGSPEAVAAALAQGYSGVLVRPYAGESMCRALEYAAAVKRDRDQLDLGRALLNTELFDKALERFAAIPDEYAREPEAAFYDGLEQLRQRNWDAAIRAFQQALGRQSFKGEAELGLALAWKGKGDQQKYRSYLERAGHSFARAAQWHRARTVYARLLQEAPAAESPFLLETERLIRLGRFEEAAAALAEGYELTSPGVVRERMARTLLDNSDDPEQDADILCRALCGKAPGVADTLAGDVRAAMEAQGGRKGRVRTGRPSARAASKSLFAQGVPLLDVDEEEAAMLQYRPASGKSLAIEPLAETSATSDAAGDMLGANDALTVAKMTWKLFRSGKL